MSSTLLGGVVIAVHAHRARLCNEGAIGKLMRYLRLVLIACHPFPAALDDAVSAYRWLLAAGADAANTIIMGDSAGGGLAIGILLKLRDDGLSLPAAPVAMDRPRFDWRFVKTKC